MWLSCPTFLPNLEDPVGHSSPRQMGKCSYFDGLEEVRFWYDDCTSFRGGTLRLVLSEPDVSLFRSHSVTSGCGMSRVPLVRFANGAEHWEAHQCVQSNCEQKQLTLAPNAVLPDRQNMNASVAAFCRR